MMTDNGIAVTADCYTLFSEESGLSVDDYGRIMTADGASPITGGVFEAMISSNATVGIYYLKIVHMDKEISIAFRVVEPASADGT